MTARRRRGPSHSGPDRNRDCGSLSVVLMLVVVIALGAGALIVDGGRALAARRHAANTAEAAARFAVAGQSLSTELDLDRARARDAAVSYASRAGVAAGDVTVEIRANEEGEQTVYVTITERRASVFLILGGQEQLTVRATGAARFTFTT